YRFNVFDGLRTGNYQVVEVVPSGWRAMTANPRAVNIPRGETFLDVDFGNARTTTSGAAPASGGSTTGDAGSAAALFLAPGSDALAQTGWLTAAQPAA